LAVGGDGVELALPVGFVGEGDGDEVTSVVVGIGTAEIEFTVDTGLGGEVKREFRLQLGVLGEHVLEDGGGSSNSDRGPSEAKDTVELADSISSTETGSVGNLSKKLVGDFDVTNSDGIVTDIAGNGTGAIHDVKGGVVGLVSRGSVLVVALMEEARRERTRLRSDPQI